MYVEWSCSTVVFTCMATRSENRSSDISAPSFSARKLGSVEVAYDVLSLFHMMSVSCGFISFIKVIMDCEIFDEESSRWSESRLVVD